MRTQHCHPWLTPDIATKRRRCVANSRSAWGRWMGAKRAPKARAGKPLPGTRFLALYQRKRGVPDLSLIYLGEGGVPIWTEWEKSGVSQIVMPLRGEGGWQIRDWQGAAGWVPRGRQRRELENLYQRRETFLLTGENGVSQIKPPKNSVGHKRHRIHRISLCAHCASCGHYRIRPHDLPKGGKWGVPD
jgi:hypothetical protein